MLERLVLRCVHAPLFRLVLDRPMSILGRSTTCDLVVTDESVSRKHAKIRVGEAAFVVTDLASRNGTFVNNIRVDTCQVRPRQTVQFGMSRSRRCSSCRATRRNQRRTPRNRTRPRATRPPLSHQADLLTPAQRQVYDLPLKALPEKSIARRLNLSPNTVHHYVSAIYLAFDVHSRTELLAAHLRALQK